jgi:hypothetical protein
MPETRAPVVAERMAPDVVRLRLRRRRSRVPWVFLVYHARHAAPGTRHLAPGVRAPAHSAFMLAAEERRDVEG